MNLLWVARQWVGRSTKDPLMVWIKGKDPRRVSGLSHDSMFGCLLCVEMCQVWSCFGLLLLYFFFCFFILHVDVPAICSAGLLVCSFGASFWDFLFLQRWVSPQKLQKCKKKKIQTKETCSLTSPFPPSDPQPNCVTHTHSQHTRNTSSTSPRLPVCLLFSVSLHLLTDSLVLLQSRKGSEQAKNVDSKTDSIGSGRAIPIKQVSSLLVFDFISHNSLGKYESLIVSTEAVYFKWCDDCNITTRHDVRLSPLDGHTKPKILWHTSVYSTSFCC